MEQARIERSIVLDLPARDAWARIVHGFSEWFGVGASLDPRPGGRVASGSKSGHLTEFCEQSLLRWEWSTDGDPGWTEIEISLHPVDGATEVRVVEILNEWEQVTYQAMGAESSRTDADLVVSVR